MAEKTSLQKSHSKASNFKLTLICLLTALFFGLLWVGLSLIVVMANYTIGGIVCAVGAVGTVLFWFLISKFTRG